MKQIPLTKGMVALVDNEDFDNLSKYKWYAHESKKGQFYARYDAPGKKRILMHRYIMGIEDRKIQVDHINGDKLDNRKENLRVASNRQNSRNHSKLKSNNTSGFRGVCFVKRTGKYVAYVRDTEGKRKHLGSFTDAVSAAIAFDKAAKEIYGEFCGKLNFD